LKLGIASPFFIGYNDVHPAGVHFLVIKENGQDPSRTLAGSQFDDGND
jgi:hypothetical protein